MRGRGERLEKAGKGVKQGARERERASEKSRAANSVCTVMSSLERS